MSNQTLSNQEPPEQLQSEEDSTATLCSRLLDTVITGDNCEVMRQWPDACIDLVVTSPPYDDLREYGKHEWDFYGVAWNLARLLKPGGVIVWNVADATKNGSETGTSMRQALHFQGMGLNIHDTMIWHKPNPIPRTHDRYEQAWEYVFVLSKGKPKTWNPIMDDCIYAGSRRTGTIQKDTSGERTHKNTGGLTSERKQAANVWSIVGRSETAHPAEFPHSVPARCVTTWSNPGDIVLDPFAGSGTTLKAAKELNRRYIGIEVNPEYVKICEERTMQESLPLYCENASGRPPAEGERGSN